MNFNSEVIYFKRLFHLFIISGNDGIQQYFNDMTYLINKIIIMRNWPNNLSN